jgi:tetratricopeptide (TPR) repeat protein
MKGRPRASQAALPRAPLDLPHSCGFRHAELEDAVLAAELPPPCSVAVIRAYRLVVAWARSPDAWTAPGQTTLFGWERRAWQSSDNEMPVWAPLATIASELGNPATADAQWLALACTALSRWAQGLGAGGTAALFAEAAAFACPADPWFACAAGDLHGRQGRPREAERWLRRASKVAVWTRNWDAQAAALGRLGTLAREAECHGDAEKLLLSALRVAKRAGLRQRLPAIWRDLFLLADASGNLEEAERCAREALNAGGPDNPGLPALAREMASIWVRHAYFARALRVLRALLRHLATPRDRLNAAACSARAAGAVGDEQAFRQAWDEAWFLAGSLGVRLRTEDALALALGALDLDLASEASKALGAVVASAAGHSEEALAHQVQAALVRPQTKEREALRRSAGIRAQHPGDVLADRLAQALEKRADAPGCTGSLAA